MIFEHDDYVDWLRQEIQEREQTNPNYSAGSFAKKLGVSKSYLSLVLNRQRKLTIKMAGQIATRLLMNESEAHYLYVLVNKEKFSDPGSRDLFTSQQNQIRQQVKLTDINLKRFRAMSDWHYSALLELITVDDIPHQTTLFAQRLGINDETVKTALQTLTEAGLITTLDGRYCRSDDSGLTTPNEIASKALRSFHHQIIKKSGQALDSQPLEKRSITGATVAIDPEKIPEAKKRIREFTQQLMEFLESGNRKEVYQLSMHMFSLENKEEEKNP